MSSAAAVAASGLGKRYAPDGGGEVWALRDVSFELAPGGSLAVVGENGSGKSTLLDLLYGAARPSEGSVRVQEPVGALLELGAGLFLELSGRDNAVQMGLLAGLTLAEARRRTDAVAAFAELAEFFERPVRSYSAGMAMRLGFAIAATLEAPVTLVDEVLAVGDGYFQRRCIDRLREMRARGTTLVIASHDLHALGALCDRALWLRHGRPVALGPADEVIARYEEHLRQRSADADVPPGRHGTGEITIGAVRLSGEGADAGAHAANDAANECPQLGFGDTLRVEVEFETAHALDAPVMGVAVFREDGVYCHGPNTLFDGVLAGSYDGRYRLVAEFPQLALLAGRYEVSVAFYDKDHVYAYAWDHRLYPFRVVGGPRDHGLVALPHRFSITKLEG